MGGFAYLAAAGCPSLPAGRLPVSGRRCPVAAPGRLRRKWRSVIIALQGRGSQAAALAGLTAALIPAILAVGIVVLGIGGEIAGVVSTYDQHAAPWAGLFVMTSVIFLTVLTGFPPATVLASAARQAFREIRPAKTAASDSQPAEPAQDPPADTAPAAS